MGLGKTNGAGARVWGGDRLGAGRKFAMWPRRQTKPPLGAPSPHVDSMPSPWSRPPHSGGASQGRASAAAGARALLRSGKSSPLPAPKARRPGRPEGQPHPATKAKRARPRADSSSMSSAKNPARAGTTALPAAPEGPSGLPSVRKWATNFTETPVFKRRAPAEEAAGGDCCKQLFLIHISLHNQIMRPTTFSIIHR